MRVVFHSPAFSLLELLCSREPKSAAVQQRRYGRFQTMLASLAHTHFLEGAATVSFRKTFNLSRAACYNRLKASSVNSTCVANDNLISHLAFKVGYDAFSAQLVAGLVLSEVAIIGGGGNIGSFLSLHLQSAGFAVSPFDMDPKILDMRVFKLHSRSFETSDLQQFGTVIFLGGCTGRKACAAIGPEERFKVGGVHG